MAVDGGADPEAFDRMEDAWFGSIDIAHTKAETIVSVGMPTGEVGGF